MPVNAGAGAPVCLSCANAQYDTDDDGRNEKERLFCRETFTFREYGEPGCEAHVLRWEVKRRFA